MNLQQNDDILYIFSLAVHKLQKLPMVLSLDYFLLHRVLYRDPVLAQHYGSLIHYGK